MARAKRTSSERAAARRRYRAAMDADLAEDGSEGRSASSSGGPARATADAPRMGIMTALRTSFRPLNVRADLAALPSLVPHKALWLPVLVTILTAVATTRQRRIGRHHATAVHVLHRHARGWRRLPRRVPCTARQLAAGHPGLAGCRRVLHRDGPGRCGSRAVPDAVLERAVGSDRLHADLVADAGRLLCLGCGLVSPVPDAQQPQPRSAPAAGPEAHRRRTITRVEQHEGARAPLTLGAPDGVHSRSVSSSR